MKLFSHEKMIDAKNLVQKSRETVPSKHVTNVASTKSAIAFRYFS